MSFVFDLIAKEEERQANAIELIASENFVSENVMRAAGSCLTNKYSEGYPAQRTSGNKGRYYGGCEYIDQLEEYCCDKWREVFNTDYHVNVQPHSGSSANLAAFASILRPGDKILAMSLDNGGHLTHGSPVNFSGKIYNPCFYNVTENGFIDYNSLYLKLLEERPQLVLAGASAYSRIIDFALIKQIIDEVSDENYHPYFMVDMAHIAGLVAAGDHPSPFGYADIITTTTHKTLRGPRGGMIFCKPELARKVDGAVFPGNQGGALQHIIAAKAVAAEEACTQEYKDYIHQVVKNCAVMCGEFKLLGYDVVTGGTENHLFLVDLSKTHPHLTGKMVQDTLDQYGITLNKNCVPNETRKPAETSGIRIGTAAMTTKGYTAKDFVAVARKIDEIINGIEA
jgi:glycine hydroxymethyltransferase